MNWLENLKVGDKVIVKTYHELGRIAEVDAVHKLHIVIKGRKYSKRSGLSVGRRGWDSPSLREATPEAVTAIRRRNAASTIITLSMAWLEKMPLAELESFLKKVEEANK